MIKLKNNQWFDLTKFGLLLMLLLMVLGLLFNLDVLVLVIYELILILLAAYLYIRVGIYKNIEIMVNKENQWYILNANETFAVKLKDYWIQTGRVFIWLQGSNKSISIVVSRSIIGAENYSQLRTKIL